MSNCCKFLKTAENQLIVMEFCPRLIRGFSPLFGDGATCHGAMNIHEQRQPYNKTRIPPTATMLSIYDSLAASLVPSPIYNTKLIGG